MEPKFKEEKVLTDRQLAVARLLFSEMTMREIAATLKIKFKTIDTCVTAIYRRLGVRTRMGVAMWISDGMPWREKPQKKKIGDYDGFYEDRPQERMETK